MKRFSAASETLDLDRLHLLAPIERPGKYLAIGMNYRKHVEESQRIGVEAPKQQLWFNKQTTCLAGPYDDKMIGPVTQATDLQVICILKHDPAGDKYIEAMQDLNGKLKGLLSSLRDRRRI